MVSDQIVGRAPSAPMRPAVVAHEQAGIATRDNGMRLSGMGN